MYSLCRAIFAPQARPVRVRGAVVAEIADAADPAPARASTTTQQPAALLRPLPERHTAPTRRVAAVGPRRSPGAGGGRPDRPRLCPEPERGPDRGRPDQAGAARPRLYVRGSGRAQDP